MSHMLRITDSTGDTRLPYETEDQQAVDAVAFQFDQFSRKGYAAFADGVKVKAFNPLAAETIMVAPIVGG